MLLLYVPWSRRGKTNIFPPRVLPSHNHAAMLQLKALEQEEPRKNSAPTACCLLQPRPSPQHNWPLGGGTQCHAGRALLRDRIIGHVTHHRPASLWGNAPTILEEILTPKKLLPPDLKFQPSVHQCMQRLQNMPHAFEYNVWTSLETPRPQGAQP